MNFLQGSKPQPHSQTLRLFQELPIDASRSHYPTTSAVCPRNTTCRRFSITSYSWIHISKAAWSSWDTTALVKRWPSRFEFTCYNSQLRNNHTPIILVRPFNETPPVTLDQHVSGDPNRGKEDQPQGRNEVQRTWCGWPSNARQELQRGMMIMISRGYIVWHWCLGFKDH